MIITMSEDIKVSILYPIYLRLSNIFRVFQNKFSVKKNDEVGRFAVVSEDLKAGDLIFSEEPFSYGPKSGGCLKEYVKSISEFYSRISPFSRMKTCFHFNNRNKIISQPQ